LFCPKAGRPVKAKSRITGKSVRKKILMGTGKQKLSRKAN
jgi:hypothetical protein